MYYVYILKSKSANKSYVGITYNKELRLRQHNKGLHFYTKRYTPWTMIYSEELDLRTEARKREKYLKSSTGRKWMKKNIF